MKVKKIMKTEIVTLSQDASCYEAARLFLEHKISGAPVVDTNGVLVGVISEKDIFRATFPTYQEFYESPESYLDFEKLETQAQPRAREKKVSDVMTKRLITAAPDTPVLKIAAQMIASGIHRVPVLDNDRLVGFVSRRDIYRAVMRRYLDLGDIAEK